MHQYPLLLETIKIEGGRFHNLKYHTERMNAASSGLNMSKGSFDLKAFLTGFSIPKTGIWKYRIFYSNKIQNIHLSKYKFRQINSLKLIEDDTIEYGFKYANREKLNRLFSEKNDCDDIIIVKNGFITDSYYGNILFFKKGNGLHLKPVY